LELPLLVAFDIKQAHDVSMPSTETQGQQPGERTDGVGSLPGAKDEQGVAVLPEERAIKTTEMVRPEHHEETEKGKSTGTSRVDAGGATSPLKKDSQQKVCNDLRLRDYVKLFDPGGAHSGFITLTIPPFISSLVCTLWVTTSLAGMM
jgi:hypothetical protein